MEQRILKIQRDFNKKVQDLQSSKRFAYQNARIKLHAEFNRIKSSILKKCEKDLKKQCQTTQQKIYKAWQLIREMLHCARQINSGKNVFDNSQKLVNKKKQYLQVKDQVQACKSKFNNFSVQIIEGKQAYNGNDIIMRIRMNGKNKLKQYPKLNILDLSHSKMLPDHKVQELKRKQKVDQKVEIRQDEKQNEIEKATNNYDKVMKEEFKRKQQFKQNIQKSAQTSIFKAVFKGKVQELYDLLKKRSTNIEATDANGNTPLLIACKRGKLEIVKILLRAGAIIDKKDENTFTPLHIASKYDNSEVVQYLIQCGADLQAVTTFKQTALHIATLNSNKDVIQVLIDNGANIDAKDLELETPLHIASRQGDIDSVRVLVRNGANILAANQYNMTPQDLAQIDQIQHILK